MYQIEDAYQVEDYRESIKLNSFPRFMGMSFHVVWFIVFAFNILGTIWVFTTLESLPIIRYILALTIFVMFLFSILYYIYLPYQVKKIFAQQKEIQLPFKMEIDESGILIENSMSRAMRTWNMFTKWKENKNVLMLYISDAAFIMLPARLLTQEVITFVHEQLRKNKIREK